MDCEHEWEHVEESGIAIVVIGADDIWVGIHICHRCDTVRAAIEAPAGSLMSVVGRPASVLEFADDDPPEAPT